MQGLYLASVWIHILAATTWTGGMALFVVAVMPYFRLRPETERVQFLAWFGPRFRKVSWWCFAVLFTTGTFNLWARGVEAGDFLRPEWHSTAFGGIVIVKLTLVAAALAVMAVHDRTTSRWRARWMGRALLLLAVIIIGLAVLLVRAS